MLLLVRQFNKLIKPAIESPNCIDPKVCDGNCCFIRIDVPRVLAEFYIQNGWAKREDFQRGDVFSFVIDVDFTKLRCTFFDKRLNGCSLHQTGVKPPQCWVYPTGLDPDQACDKCKKAKGWKIIDPESVQKANKIIDQYFQLAKEEALTENSETMIIQRLGNGLFQALKNSSPASIAGITDTWEKFIPLKGDGMNIGTRLFCRKNTSCTKEYFECSQMCENVILDIIANLKELLPKFIATCGYKKDYIFFELKEFNDKQKNN